MRKIPIHFNYQNIFWITLVHVMALVAIPFFSWPNLAAVLFGTFLLAPLGVNIGYHRLLSHKSFTPRPALTYSLACLGAALGAGPPIHWAAMHRIHHRYSDQELDPHNSRKGFWYSHVLHLFVIDAQEDDGNYLKMYAPDLMRDRFLSTLNRYWIWLALAVLPCLYLIGGIGLVLWAGFVRLCLTWHIMWFVNSASHTWGYRNYETNDRTKNCWWVGLLAAGEGWHNNHHAFPSHARHGVKWWEVDFSYWLILVLKKLGLITEIKGSKQ